MAKEKVVVPPKKERFRNFTIRFNEPLSNKVLETLPEERKFISKYRNIDTIKINNIVVGLLIRDSFDVAYSINSKEIVANSAVQPNDRVIEKLKLLGDRIAELYELGQNSYELIMGADFQYLESFDFQNAITKNNLIEKLQKEFEKVGVLSLVVCKFVFNTGKEEEEETFINLAYADQNDLSKKRLLIEADEKHLDKVIDILKK